MGRIGTMGRKRGRPPINRQLEQELAQEDEGNDTNDRAVGFMARKGHK